MTELERRERKKESSLKFYHKNKERLNERKKAYDQSEQGKKAHRIARWKHRGIICENFDNLYDYYINCKNCEQCNVELTFDKRRKSTTRCLDHCHETGEFRNVLCHCCNVKRR